jgi:O-antigen ligase
MAGIFERLDGLAGIEEDGFAVKWLERTAFVFLVLMVTTAPHSIAASQASWILGMLATVIRFALKPRINFRFHALGIALCTLFLWAVISSFFSYEPAISLDKLRGVSLFLVFFFAYLNIRRLSAVYFLAFALIFSCMINVAWVIGERIVGRGVEVHGIAPEGPLAKLKMIEGATIVRANGKRLHSPEELIAEIEQNGSAKMLVYQYEFYNEVDLNRNDLLPGSSAQERLGITGWSRSYNWRAQGFFGHFTTYAEALQLIASLLLGLIVAAIVRKREQRSSVENKSANPVLRLLTSTPFLIVTLAAMCLALLLTVTRASQLGFMVSAFSIVTLSGNRKLLVAAFILAIPVILGGLLFLQETRNVGFLDTSDESTLYRITMWQDGIRLSTENAHNFIFGLGMDSIKKHWQEWGMFKGGMLPMGHFHSTPIQLLVERGLPSLLIWLAIIGIYLRILWRGLTSEKVKRRGGEARSFALGILLGCFGACAGFFTSGLVHYNLGDGEVAMIFYLLMAFGAKTSHLIISDESPDAAASSRAENRMAA